MIQLDQCLNDIKGEWEDTGRSDATNSEALREDQLNISKHRNEYRQFLQLVFHISEYLG